MKVVLIGTGNVASVLGRRIAGAGHTIEQVYGRTPENAAALGKQLGCDWVSDPASITNQADLFLVAISDNALKEAGQWLKPGNKLIVHTAGSVSKEVLKNASVEYGVFYPLQSLRNLAKEPSNIPFLIDASSPESIGTLENLAREIGSGYQVCGDEQRLRMHLAAVWVNNFPNAMYAIAYRICIEKGLDFSLLQPLIQETAGRINNSDPLNWQTGPAVRNDNKTIEQHGEILSDHPDWRSLYIELTNQIQEMNRLYSNG